jgi:hypothetical protein
MIEPVKHSCGQEVQIYVTARGARGETSSYGVKCPSCGLVVDNLPSNCSGRKTDAIREWNKIQKIQKR